MSQSPPFHVVIPARHGSSRLPGKPLRPLAGRPLIAHVVARAREAGAREVIVATDDERIVAAAEAAGARALLTDPAHPSGTDRAAEVARREGWAPDAVVVNLQGDEPLIPPGLPRLVAETLLEDPAAGIATLVTPLRDAAELFDPHVVKAVLDAGGHALYFSRAPLPWVRDRFRPGETPAALPEGVPFYRHIGLYAYRVGDLLRIARQPACPLERAESLEQLRALWHGITIATAVVETPPPHGVDTEADLQRVEALLQGQG